MGTLADIYDMKGNEYTPPQNYEIIPGGAKLTKAGKIKQTPNNGTDDHFVFPIKELDKIEQIKEYLWSKVDDPASRPRDRWAYGRNYLMFCIGINVGLRYSDLVNLTWNMIFRPDMKTFRTSDTRNKKEQKTGKLKTIFINKAIQDAVTRYINRFNPELGKDVSVFAMDGRKIIENTKSIIDEETGKIKKVIISSYTIIVGDVVTEMSKDSYRPPISDTAVGNFIKEASAAVGIKYAVCTHTLRKTYAYHLYVMNQDNPFILPYIQKMLGHVNQSDTIRYLGLEREMQERMVMGLNL